MMKHVKNNVDGNDTFNKLHDDQLRHIINLLPVKDAVRTSLLSSRWKNLWLCISNIDLDGIVFKSRISYQSFLNSIDRLLFHHDNSYIKRFCLSSDGTFVDPKNTCRWISEVIKHNVEELCIGSGLGLGCLYPPLTLPFCLVNCESLKVLEIVIDNDKYRSVILGSDSDLFTVHLPSLTRLKLSSVEFLDNRSIHQFFSNTPKLQYLCLCRCVWHKVTTPLVIDIPTLEGVDIAVRNTGNLRCRVTIIAPNLTSFKCDTDFSVEFLVSSNHSLSQLDVYLKFYILGEIDRHALPRLLESVKHAMSLHLEWNFRIDLWLVCSRIPVEDLPLMNLKQFEISTDHFSSCHDIELEKIFMLLHRMPNMVSLTISVPRIVRWWNFSNQSLEDIWTRDGIPSCVINQIRNLSIIISSNSRTIDIERSEFKNLAMELIKYFLNHSRNLEILEISLFCYSFSPTQDILDEEIKRHPRYAELKRLSYHTYDIPKPLSMYFPWDDVDPGDHELRAD